MYYRINEDAARRAKEMNSFSAYVPGTATDSYKQMVDAAAALAESCKAKVDPMYHEKIDSLLDTYSRKLADNLNEGYSIECRCPSVMIAGGSNFPVNKKLKQNAARDRNMEEYKHVQSLLDKIRSVGTGGIRGDDPNALEKLEQRLSKLEQLQELMKAANAAVRMKDTAKGDAKLAELGYSPENIRDLRTPDFCGRIGYPSFELSNNNANIHRIRDRIADLKKLHDAPADGWTFDGGEVVMNQADARIQILFDGKPDEDTRTELKQNGFRWAPSKGAWQRQLTANGIRAVKNLKCVQSA